MTRKKFPNPVSHMRNILTFNKVKIKSFIAFILFIFISLATILTSGCFYSDNFEDMDGISLNGVKVLRKPFSYNWSSAVPPDGQGYYEQYASDIFSYLFNIYGVINHNPLIFQKTRNPFSEIIRFETSPDEDLNRLSENYKKIAEGTIDETAEEFVPFYDAIRHQITDIQTVTEAVNGEMVTYRVVRADLGASWNWGLPYNLPSDQENVTNSLIYEYVTNGIYNESGAIKPKSAKINNGILENKILSVEWGYDVIQSFYSMQDYQFEYTEQNKFNNNLYSTQYLNSWSDPTLNSEYITALTYAIYSIVLGLKPAEISVTYNDNTGEPIVSVAGFEPKDGKSSAQLALENRQQLFNELGSYVGLTAKNKGAIADYLLDSVIGDGAMRYNDKMLYDKVITSVVNYCSTLTKIGITEGADDDYRDDDLDKAFPASEIVDYPFSTFFVDGFVEDAFWNIPYAEYQSLLFMPSNATKISDLWLDFKYDAGMDGDEIYDPTKFLEIDVHYRYYAGDGREPKVSTMSIKIYDGPIDWGYVETAPLMGELETMFGGPLKIGPLEIPDAINAMDREDKTIVLTGLVDARRYYKLLESSTSGGYGVIDNTKIDQAYLEVAFDVHKKPGDNMTNYKFKVGISLLFETINYLDDPVWR